MDNDTLALLNDVEFHQWLVTLEEKDVTNMDAMFEHISESVGFDGDEALVKHCNDLLDGRFR